MKYIVLFSISALVFCDVTYGATEYATFESFYKESVAVWWIVAALFAATAGGLILWSGGAASPAVAYIGGWIGSSMGLSGAAATNAGLALLGGGSIASGGLGMAGGTALLTAALSFGTDVVFDYAIGKVVSEYEYGRLTEESKKLQTLPLPSNGSGPEAYEDAIEILKGVDLESPYLSENNKEQHCIY